MPRRSAPGGRALLTGRHTAQQVWVQGRLICAVCRHGASDKRVHLAPGTITWRPVGGR